MLVVRLASPKDAHEIADLINDMAGFYKEKLYPANDIVAYLSSLPLGVEFLLAMDEMPRPPLAKGFVAFATLAPGPNLEPQFFMKDLYVKSCFRHQGVGTALMNGIKTAATRRGYSRIDWAVESGNENAKRLYGRIGAAPIDRLYYRLILHPVELSSTPHTDQQ